MASIERLREDGVLSAEQAATLAAIDSRVVFSVSAELRALFYVGALFLIAGVGATVRRYFDQLGPMAIVSALSLAVAGCLYYVESRRLPYSQGEVESPTAAYDYVLFIGCALLGVLATYLETQFHLLREHWDWYLLGSAALFFALAYRHDNRLLLGMALINLGAWIGVRLHSFDFMGQSLRFQALAYGALVVAAGLATHRKGMKAHFLDTFLNVGLNLLFCAALSDVVWHGFASPYLLLLGILAAGTSYAAVSRRRFVYFLYAAFYGYVGLTACVVRELKDAESIALYLMVTGGFLVWGLFRFRNVLEQTE